MKILSFFVSMLLLVESVSAVKSVAVFSSDEALNETNFSKPRIFIQNTGDEPISDFYYKYKFKTKVGNTPVLEDFYTPNSKISLVNLGNGEYEVVYDFSGATLEVGQVLPNTAGNIIGIHNADWSEISKENDESNNLSSKFALNNNISVYTAQGVLISGANSIVDALPPIAEAGGDLVFKDDGTGSQTVFLDGFKSYDPDGNIAQYVWSVDGGETFSGRETSVILPVGTFTVTLTVTDMDGLVDTDEITVSVVSKNASGFELEVCSKDLALNENNISKPRTYIKNKGAKALEGFYYCYFIKQENLQNVVLADWYSPKSNVSLEKLNDEYYMIKYDFSTVTLNPGQVIPNKDGNSVGVHFKNWINYDKTKDFSFVNSSSFVENENIAVYDINGILIYGNSPVNIGNSEPNITIETEDVDNNPLGEMEINVKIINNADEPLSLKDKQVYYYFTEGSDVNLTVSGYKLDGVVSNDDYLTGVISERTENSAVRVDIEAGEIAPYGEAEFKILLTKTAENFNENDDYSYIMSSTFTENEKVVLVDSKDMTTLYGESPDKASIYGIYDLRVSPNPISASMSSFKVFFNITDNAYYTAYFYNSKGMYVHGTAISGYPIPTSKFEKNKIQTVKLYRDGILSGVSSFIIID